MNFKKYKIFIAFILLFTNKSFSQQDTTTSKHLQISVITCSQGNELYAVFGHTAIRIIDSTNHTDIFYNYGFRGTTYTISEASCYNPRNAILFLDSRGKAIEFIEICFECSRILESSEKVNVGDLCDQKMDMLKELFKNVGIEYGITKGLISGD